MKLPTQWSTAATYHLFLSCSCSLEAPSSPTPPPLRFVLFSRLAKFLFFFFPPTLNKTWLMLSEVVLVVTGVVFFSFFFCLFSVMAPQCRAEEGKYLLHAPAAAQWLKRRTRRRRYTVPFLLRNLASWWCIVGPPLLLPPVDNGHRHPVKTNDCGRQRFAPLCMRVRARVQNLPN